MYIYFVIKEYMLNWYVDLEAPERLILAIYNVDYVSDLLPYNLNLFTQTIFFLVYIHPLSILPSIRSSLLS